MNRLALPAIAGLAAILVATFVLHYQAPRTEYDILPLPSSTPSAAPATPARAATGAESTIQAHVDAILARPLFNPTRRPAAAPAAQQGGPTNLPRLSAVLVGSQGKTVIFAGEGAAKPITLSEGGRIGPYRVQSIAAGQVTLDGPAGPQILRPTPTGATPTGANAAAQPSLIDLMNQANPNALILPPPPMPAPAPAR